MLFEAADSVSHDSIEIGLAGGERLLVRSVVDGRERMLVLCHGREQGLKLARALIGALDPEAAR